MAAVFGVLLSSVVNGGTESGATFRRANGYSLLLITDTLSVTNEGLPHGDPSGTAD